MPNPYMPQYSGGYQDPSLNRGGPGNPRGAYNYGSNSAQQQGAFYGPWMPQSFSGQQPGLDRYTPPMMQGGNPAQWMNGGGYSYNLPNSYGHAYNGGYGGVVPNYQYGGNGGFDPYAQYGGGGNFMRNASRGMYGYGGPEAEARVRSQWAQNSSNRPYWYGGRGMSYGSDARNPQPLPSYGYGRPMPIAQSSSPLPQMPTGGAGLIFPWQGPGG